MLFTFQSDSIIKDEQRRALKAFSQGSDAQLMLPLAPVASSCSYLGKLAVKKI